MSRLKAGLLLSALIPVGAALADAPLVITQTHRSFSVRDVQIKQGSVIHFTNSDEFIHHLFIDSPSMKFNSGEQSPGQDVDVRFDKTGTFEVRCEIHPRMVLTVVVK